MLSQFTTPSSSLSAEVPALLRNLRLRLVLRPLFYLRLNFFLRRWITLESLCKVLVSLLPRFIYVVNFTYDVEPPNQVLLSRVDQIQQERPGPLAAGRHSVVIISPVRT